MTSITLFLKYQYTGMFFASVCHNAVSILFDACEKYEFWPMYKEKIGKINLSDTNVLLDSK